jgi:hypothetical protein
MQVGVIRANFWPEIEWLIQIRFVLEVVEMEETNCLNFDQKVTKSTFCMLKYPLQLGNASYYLYI